MHPEPAIAGLIRRRTSSRTYDPRPIEPELRERFSEQLSVLCGSPFGSPVRLALIAAGDEEHTELRGLGTYGFIHGASGYIVGAAGPGAHNLEDYGYCMERAVLAATALGLGTCWLGGTLTRSSFARRVGLARGERMPAVTATGYPAGHESAVGGVTRKVAGSHQRLPWESLFFDGTWGVPLAPGASGAHALPLEMVRLGPSASNKQPWRILREGERWHFYMHRAPLYRPLTLGLVRLADMPRLDMGIALCHFELTARGLGLPGAWRVLPRNEVPPAEGAEYTATWVVP